MGNLEHDLRQPNGFETLLITELKQLNENLRIINNTLKGKVD